MKSDWISAAQLLPGQSGRVTELRHSGSLRRRLMEMGIIPGVTLLRRYTAPSGSPIAFEAAGTVIAIRRRDAELLMVQEAHSD